MPRHALQRAVALLLQVTTRPDRFFADHDSAYAAAPAMLIGFGFAIFLGVAVVALGAIMATTIDVTVVVDNPDRPSEWVCDRHGGDPDSPWYDRCQEPEQVERPVGPMLYDIALARVPLIVITGLFFWPILGGVFHVAARAAGGTGSIGNSLSIAAFCLLPEYVRVVLVIAIFFVSFDAATLTGPTPDAVVDQLLTVIEELGPIILGISLITALWQLFIVTYGLKHGHDLPIGKAIGAGAAVIALLVLIELL